MDDSCNIITWPNPVEYNSYPKIKELIENLNIELKNLYHCKDNGDITGRKEQIKTNSNKLVKALKTKTNRMLFSTKKNLCNETSTYPLKQKVEKAYKNRKIFTVYGNYGTIRKALLSRGWIEKLAPGRRRKLQGLPEHVLKRVAKAGNEYETVAISQAIDHLPAFFIWQPKMQQDLSADVLPYRNRVRRSPEFDFSTKVGLIGCTERCHWNGEHVVRYPRFYRLANRDEISSFIDDFRITQCLCLLTFICATADPTILVDSEMGTVNIDLVNFAITKVEEDIALRDHQLIDGEKGNECSYDEYEKEWQDFILGSNVIIRHGAKFKTNEWILAGMLLKAKPALEMTILRRPTVQLDGVRNLWILKPGYQCRGIGIAIMCNVNNILDYSANHPRSRYIVQKYIERPLLIYNTKFDIRQYFLLSIRESYIAIWMYNDCYLRFSSREFSFDDLGEAVHLTNNCVQKKYKIGSRDERLPANNMWSLERFKEYLKLEFGNENAWKDVISAGMQHSVIAIVLASLEETTLIPNAFEIYGCDFMLDESLQPILIEINSTPDMSPSTSVTAHICNAALKDLIKVVVDLPQNSNASTGGFELVHQISYAKSPTNPPSLLVDGKTVKLHEPPALKKTNTTLRRRPTKVNITSESTNRVRATKPAPITPTVMNSLNPNIILKKSEKVLQQKMFVCR